MAMKDKRQEIYSYVVKNLKSFGIDIVSIAGFDNQGDLHIFASEGLGITKFPEKTRFKKTSRIMKTLLNTMHTKGIFEIHDFSNLPGLKKYLYLKMPCYLYHTRHMQNLT
jgi:hypothetical protein